METCDFLVALGLDEEADVRAIRRAYGRRLKTVDQTDVAQFQALREAYEMALAWAGDQPGDGSPASSGQTAPLPARFDIPTAETQRCLDIAWERYQAAVAGLAGTVKLADVDAWQNVLGTCLADEVLVNIDARTLFEWRIAQTLAGGWQPGHETLFPAAITVFGWAGEYSTLAQCGVAGRVLEQAVGEYMLYNAQAIAVRSVQERLLMLLRKPRYTNLYEIVNSIGELAKMQTYFPALLLVVADAENVGHWHTVYHDHLVQDTPPPRVRERLPRWWVYLCVLCALLAGGLYLARNVDSARAAGDPTTTLPVT